MDLFEYIAVLTSIIIGLAITHILRGVARLIQHPDTNRIYWVHLCWVGYLFLIQVFWWWWEFRLGDIEVWTFQLYMFIVFYAVLVFLTSSMLFPDDLEGYDGYRDYFFARRTWFFGLLLLLLLTDVADSLAKGVDYWLALGIEYHVVRALQAILCIVAMISRHPRFHGTFAIAMLLYQSSWAIRQYWTVD